MIVRCVELLDEQTGQTLTKSAWLTVGKQYIVLGIYVSFGATVQFRLLGDDDSTPALHDASQFQVISGFIPSEWKVRLIPRKLMLVEPEPWLTPGFWESYFDADPKAVEVFRESYRRIVAEHATGQVG